MTQKKQSPLKDNPLRNPGQTLDEEISKTIGDDAAPYILAPVVSIAFAGLEWWRWHMETPPSPIILTLVACVITAVSIYKLLGYRKHVIRLRLGRDGERAVGQYLELLREKGYRVFHDLVGDNFNLDHVIVCAHGIYVIETKTYSKNERGTQKIVFNGNEIIVNGFNTGEKIVTQANAQAKWLQTIIKDSTGKSFPVKPVVVFPGWYIESKKTQQNNLWVLNPKALPAYIGNAPKSLANEDVTLVSFHISRFIRVSQGLKP